MNYKYENGRRYHAYNEGNYMLPNDESEQGHLDMLHHVFKVLTGGELWRAPIRGPNAALPRRVLDLGTGTGVWAMEAAEELTGATIIGNDLSAIAPKFIPSNCQFVVDDFEQPWTYPKAQRFDFIHGRALSGSVSDFPRLLKQIHDNLNPGGWVEFQDYTGEYQSDDNSLRLVQAMTEWHRQLCEASEKAGKPLRIADEYKRLFQEAGFVDVQEDRYKVCSTLEGLVSKLTLGRHRSEHGPKARPTKSSGYSYLPRTSIQLSRSLSLCTPGCWATVSSKRR